MNRQYLPDKDNAVETVNHWFPVPSNNTILIMEVANINPAIKYGNPTEYYVVGSSKAEKGANGPKAIDLNEKSGAPGLEAIDLTEKCAAIGLEAIDPHTQTDSDNELLEIINDLLEIDDSYTKLPKVDIATAINEIDRANKVATILVQLVAKSKENPCGEGIGSTIDVQDRNGDMIRCSLYDTGYRKYHADLQVSSKTTEKFTVDFEI